MRTPAQAYGHPRFADDYPWDGGYGEGERRSACRNAAEITAKRPGGPCSGILPSWITNYPSGMLSGVRYNGRCVPGFGVGQVPDVFLTLTPAQQSWVQTTLGTLNSKILAASRPCATWASPTVNLPAAVSCFQSWANSLQVLLSPGGALRTDGVIDPATLTALLALATQIHPEDFPTPFPATPATAPVQAAAQSAGAAAVAVSPTPAAAAPLTPEGKPVVRKDHGLSTAAKVGIGVGIAGVLGTGVYLATRGGGKKKRRRR